MAPALGQRVIGRGLHNCSIAIKKVVIGAAAVTVYKSSASIRLNVIRRIYKGCLGNRQNVGHLCMVSPAPRSISKSRGSRIVFLEVLR